MNRQRLATLIVLALAVTAPLGATDSPAGSTSIAADGPALFERLKTLVGEWRGHWEPGDTETTVTYCLTGKGTVLVEDYRVGKTTMLTLYHLDGEELMLTHYCSAGNQPRMTLSSLSDDARELVFTAFDVTNAGERGYSKRLTLRLIDEEHIAVSYLGSRTEASSGVSLERVR